MNHICLVSDIIAISSLLYMCSKKRWDLVFDDKMNNNCPFTKLFGTLITKTIGHRQVFLFFHLTYLVQLLYLGNCRDLNTKYQLNTKI